MPRLLLAVDRSESADTAVDYAAATARRDGSEVVVVHVAGDRAGRLWRRHRSGTSDLAAAGAVRRAMQTLKEMELVAWGYVVSGGRADVAGTIVDVAEQAECDAIVLGSRRRGAGRFGRRGRGVREKVVDRTSLPVVTAPAPLGAIDLRQLHHDRRSPRPGDRRVHIR